MYHDDLADTNDGQEIPYAANQRTNGSPWFNVVILHYSSNALHSSCDKINVILHMSDQHMPNIIMERNGSRHKISRQLKQKIQYRSIELVATSKIS